MKKFKKTLPWIVAIIVGLLLCNQVSYWVSMKYASLATQQVEDGSVYQSMQTFRGINALIDVCRLSLILVFGYKIYKVCFPDEVDSK